MAMMSSVSMSFRLRRLQEVALEIDHGHAAVEASVQVESTWVSMRIFSGGLELKSRLLTSNGAKFALSPGRTAMASDARGGIGILEGTGVGGDGGVEVEGDVAARIRRPVPVPARRSAPPRRRRRGPPSRWSASPRAVAWWSMLMREIIVQVLLPGALLAAALDQDGQVEGLRGKSGRCGCFRNRAAC